MVVHIVPYEQQKHSPAVFRLWHATLHELWPLDVWRLQQVLMREGTHFVALDDNEAVVGFVATTIQEKAGHISLILVDPQEQRQGIGTMLHDKAISYIRQRNITQLFLGGGPARFFPGLPDNLPQAITFFQAHEWNFKDEPYHIVYDLTQDIRGYETPLYIEQRVAEHHIFFSTVDQTQVEELLAFEAHEFPEWLDAFKRVIEYGDFEDLLVGRDRTRHIVASLIMYNPYSHQERLDVLWQGIFGKKLGAIGCVGVAEQEQGLGIGIALVARATELLRERGVEHCSIDWVVLTDFYAKLGYRIWRGYHMCNRNL